MAGWSVEKMVASLGYRWVEKKVAQLELLSVRKKDRKLAEK